MDTSWLPVTDGQFLVWFNGFRQKLQQYQASLGLDPIDVLEVENDYKAYAYTVAQIDSLRTELLNRVEFKTILRDGPEGTASLPYPGSIIFAEHPSVTVRPGVMPRLVRFVSKIKQSSGYTLEIGEDLGIEPKGVEVIPTFPQNIVPIAENGMVRLEFNKSMWQGVQVESQRGDEADWTVLGTVYESPFIDARPPAVPGMAESRRYRLRYLDAVEPVGTYSATVQVIVPGTPVRAVVAESVTVR